MEVALAYAPILVLMLPLLACVTLPFCRRFIPSHYLLPSTISYSLFLGYSFYLLIVLTENSMAYTVSFLHLHIGLYADQLTAATLMLVAVICWQTILTTPVFGCKQDGFLSLISFSLSALCISALLITDNLMSFFILWTVLDLGVYLGHYLHQKQSKQKRWQVFILLQATSFFVLGAIWSLGLTHQSTNFHHLFLIKDSVSSLLLTGIIIILFMGSAVKVGTFSYSIWVPLALMSKNTIPSVPFIHGIIAVLPGIYLLTRLHPLYSMTLIPVPLVLLGAILLGIFLFSHLEQQHT